MRGSRSSGGEGRGGRPTDLGVAAGVLQQVEQELAGLGGPAALAVVGALVLSLSGTADTAVVPAEDDAALVGQNILGIREKRGRVSDPPTFLGTAWRGKARHAESQGRPAKAP